MLSFKRDGHDIAYEVHGTGVPVLLLHGVTVNFAGNYLPWGWVQQLVAAGYQVIGMDFRGHGKSSKPHDPAAYGMANLAGDALALLDHLGHRKASLIGYSLGSAVALHLLHSAPEQVGPSVLIATGDGLLGHPPHDLSNVFSKLATALSREQVPEDLPPHEAAYWTFAVNVGGDRLAALAAVQALYAPCTEIEAASIKVPVLVISGELDPVLGRGPRLAQTIPGAGYLEMPGTDHFALCRIEPAITAAVKFLAQHRLAAAA